MSPIYIGTVLLGRVGPKARVTMAYTETVELLATHARVTMAYTETVVKP